MWEWIIIQREMKNKRLHKEKLTPAPSIEPFQAYFSYSEHILQMFFAEVVCRIEHCNIKEKKSLYRVFLLFRTDLNSLSYLHFSSNFVDRYIWYIDQQNWMKNEGMRASLSQSGIKETPCI